MKKSDFQRKEYTDPPSKRIATDVQNDYCTIKDSDLCLENQLNAQDDHYFSFKEEERYEYNKTKATIEQMPNDSSYGLVVDKAMKRKEENTYDHLNGRRFCNAGIKSYELFYVKSECQTVTDTKDMTEEILDKNVTAIDTSSHLLPDDTSENRIVNTNSHLSDKSVNELSKQKLDLANVTEANSPDYSTEMLGQGNGVWNKAPTGTEHPYFVLTKDRGYTNKSNLKISAFNKDIELDSETAIMNSDNPKYTYFETNNQAIDEQNKHDYSPLQFESDPGTETEDNLANVHDYLQLKAVTDLEQTPVKETAAT